MFVECTSQQHLTSLTLWNKLYFSSQCCSLPSPTLLQTFLSFLSSLGPSHLIYRDKNFIYVVPVTIMDFWNIVVGTQEEIFELNVSLEILSSSGGWTSNWKEIGSFIPCDILSPLWFLSVDCGLLEGRVWGLAIQLQYPAPIWHTVLKCWTELKFHISS